MSSKRGDQALLGSRWPRDSRQEEFAISAAQPHSLVFLQNLTSPFQSKVASGEAGDGAGLLDHLPHRRSDAELKALGLPFA